MNSVTTVNPGQQRTFTLSRAEWKTIIVFMLSMSLTGLKFYPAFLVTLGMLTVSWRRCREDFIIQLMLVAGGYGLMPDDVLGVRLSDLALPVGLAGMLITRKDAPLRRVTAWIAVYIAITLVFGCLSHESLAIQLLMMRRYWLIAWAFVVVMAFSGQTFRMGVFIRYLTGYALVMSSFYVLDGLILNGFILLPGLPLAGHESGSTFWHPVMRLFQRQYPMGMVIWGMLVYPLCQGWLRLSRWQWILAGVAALVTRTASFMGGTLISWIVFRGHGVRMVQYALVGAAMVTAGYFVDSATGGSLRIASTVDQFTGLAAIKGQEDLMEFGTGRMAQFLPKYDLLMSQHRQLQGFGFLHPEYSDKYEFMVINPFYKNSTTKAEVATGVEVTQLQTVLDMGWIGLILQCVVYLGIWWSIRKLRYSGMYLCVLLTVSLYGIGGFGGVTGSYTLLMLATTLAAVLLANKPRALALDDETQDQQK